MRRGLASATVMAIVLILSGHPRPSAVSSQQVRKEGTRKAEVVPKPVEPIDPRGEPKPAAIKAISGPKVCLTYERDGWEVQLRPGNEGWSRIDGSIEALEGEIAKVNGFGNLETAKPGKKNEHADRGKFDKRHIEFAVWVKTGGMDTFHFNVSEETQTLRCRFRINGGTPTGEIVLIGKNARHPSQGEFYLRARPDETPATRNKTAAGANPKDAPKAKPAGK